MHAEQTRANLFPSRCWKGPSQELNRGKSQISHDQTPKPWLAGERGEPGVIQPRVILVCMSPRSLFGSGRSRRDFHWNSVAYSYQQHNPGRPLTGATQMGAHSFYHNTVHNFAVLRERVEKGRSQQVTPALCWVLLDLSSSWIYSSALLETLYYFENISRQGSRCIY